MSIVYFCVHARRAAHHPGHSQLNIFNPEHRYVVGRGLINDLNPSLLRTSFLAPRWWGESKMLRATRLG